jgi:hypothetical protein
MIKVTYILKGDKKTVYKKDKEEAIYFISKRRFISGYRDFKIGEEELKEVEKDTNNTKIEKMPKLEDF